MTYQFVCPVCTRQISVFGGCLEAVARVVQHNGWLKVEPSQLLARMIAKPPHMPHVCSENCRDYLNVCSQAVTARGGEA